MMSYPHGQCALPYVGTWECLQGVPKPALAHSNLILTPIPWHICTPIPLSGLVQPRPQAPTSAGLRPSPLWPQVSAPGHFLHWMTPFGLKHLNDLSHLLPVHLLAREWL